MRLLLIPFLAFLVSCQADPTQKKIPYEEKKFVAKGVDINFSTEVDILMVIDDSGSMSSAQKNLAANSEIFADQFFLTRFIDFHIGTITSSTTESIWGNHRGWGGRLLRDMGPHFVDRNTKNGRSILESYMQPGTDGDGNEKFFNNIETALGKIAREDFNEDFYREDAHLVVIFVTDTDDQSGLSPQYIFDYLRDLKGGDSKRLTVAAAVIDQPKPGCSRDVFPPNKIKQLVALADGTTFDFCADDYGKDLVRIAQVVVRQNSTIKLSRVPVESTIVVTYGKQTIPREKHSGWTYDADKNVIYLGADIELAEEPEGTKVRVKFETVYK